MCKNNCRNIIFQIIGCKTVSIKDILLKNDYKSNGLNHICKKRHALIEGIVELHELRKLQNSPEIHVKQEKSRIQFLRRKKLLSTTNLPSS